uniref:(northern house mosquito) hypothetical protein n=1 Tax=Culex pipiens TaxID=7175 RepID=A0A8D8HI31_CULPI
MAGVVTTTTRWNSPRRCAASVTTRRRKVRSERRQFAGRSRFSRRLRRRFCCRVCCREMRRSGICTRRLKSTSWERISTRRKVPSRSRCTNIWDLRLQRRRRKQ